MSKTRVAVFSLLAVLIVAAVVVWVWILRPLQQPSAPDQVGRNILAPGLQGGDGSSEPKAGAETTPQTPTGPVVGEPVKPAAFDGDLRDLPQVGPLEKSPMFELEREGEEEAARPEVPDPVVQNWAGELNMPSPLQSFLGLDLAAFGAGWPPDPNGDVGPDHYIQTVNTSIGIYNKTGTRLAAFTFDNFFSGTGTPCDDNNNGDPVVLYDPVSGRWIITDFAWADTVNGPYYECIAVSMTVDPVSGGWWFYALRADDASHPWLNDYPKLGIWSDAVYMTANMFDMITTTTGTYEGVRIWALNRSDMISGAALRTIRFDLGTAYFTLLPANLRGDLPPAGRPNYLAAIDTFFDDLQLWKFHVDWTTPANSTLTGPTNLSVAAFSEPSGRVPQSGSTETVDILGDRLMMQLQYRNLSGTETLWVNHSVASGGVTGIRWYEIRDPNGSPLIYQQSTYQPDSLYRWMGAIAVDHQGNAALGYSVSSSAIFPEIRYAGRLATDPLNTLAQGETTLIAGTGSQSGGFNRWGDYSALSVDPLDDCTFWYTTEYYVTTGNNWQTRIGSFKYPSCTAQPDFTLSAAPASQSICTPDDALFDVTLGALNGFSNPVTLAATGNPTGTTTGFSPNPLTPPGSSDLTIGNTGATAAGDYTIHISGTSGSLVHQQDVELRVFTDPPGGPTLLSPLEGSTGVSIIPTFTWDPVGDALSYDIQVASDPGFTTIVASATGLTTTSYTPPAPLSYATAYYWRVRANNACGSGPWSEVFALLTGELTSGSFCSSPNLAIPDGNPSGVSTDQVLATTGPLADLNVSIQADHTWVGDLVFSLQKVGEAASAAVIHRPGVPASTYGCSGNNINATLDDEAASPVENVCAPSPPTISGTFTPNDPLSVFDGVGLAGAWRITASDYVATDTGTLNQWCLIADYLIPFAADFSDLPASYGVAWHTGDGDLRIGDNWSADLSFAPHADDADDDGITIDPMVVGQPGDVAVVIQGVAANGVWLQAWFDWNDDGDFGDAGENVYDASVGAAGSINTTVNFSVTPPSGAETHPQINYRFRLFDSASSPGLAPSAPLASSGGAGGGEVTDDDSPPANPTAVTLAGFTAHSTASAISIDWETALEINILGFNLYRAAALDGSQTRLNDDVIPSQASGSLGGASYAFLDDTALPGIKYYYWLEVVPVNGSPERHGPVSAVVLPELPFQVFLPWAVR